jgi:hypothetical protein
MLSPQPEIWVNMGQYVTGAKTNNLTMCIAAEIARCTCTYKTKQSHTGMIEWEQMDLGMQFPTSGSFWLYIIFYLSSRYINQAFLSAIAAANMAISTLALRLLLVMYKNTACT